MSQPNTGTPMDTDIKPPPPKIIPVSAPINTDAIHKRVWLVKIPAFLAEKWSTVTEEGIELGTVRIYNPTPLSPRKVTLHIAPAPFTLSIPKNYTLTFTNTNPENEYVFTEEPVSGTAISVAGKVHHEANVTPIIDEEYRRIMQARTIEATSTTRGVKIMDKTQGKNQQFIVPNLTMQMGFGSMKRNKNMDKKERLPREEVLNILFGAFSKQEFWSIRALGDLSQQPQQWLKEILNDVAILIKRGPQLGTYQLKSEFKPTTTVVKSE